MAAGTLASIYQGVSKGASEASALIGSSLSVTTAAEATSLWNTLAVQVATVGVKVVAQTIGEMFEEIVVDGFIEAYFENSARMLGWTAGVGQLISTLMTTVRETKMFGAFNLGGQSVGSQGEHASLTTELSQLIAELESSQSFTEEAFLRENREKVRSIMSKLDLVPSRHETILKMAGIVGSGVFAGLSLLVPGLSFAGFSLYGFNPMIKHLGQKVLSPRAGTTTMMRAAIKNARQDMISKDMARIINGLSSVKKDIELSAELRSRSDEGAAVRSVNGISSSGQAVEYLVDSKLVVLTPRIRAFIEYSSELEKIYSNLKDKNQIIEESMGNLEVLKENSEINELFEELSSEQSLEQRIPFKVPEACVSYGADDAWKYKGYKTVLVPVGSGYDTETLKPTMLETFKFIEGYMTRKFKVKFAEEPHVGLWQDQVIAPGVFYLGQDGKAHKMRENSILPDLLKNLGHQLIADSKGEILEQSFIELVPISQLTQEQRNQLPTDTTRGYFYDKELNDFYYEKFNFYFKSQIQEVIKNDADADVFREAYNWIKEIALESDDRFLFGSDVSRDKYHVSQLETSDSFSREGSMLKNHFDNYFITQSMEQGIRDSTGSHKEERVELYKQLVDKLFMSLVSERLINTEEDPLFDKVYFKLEFTILDYLMKEAGITDKDVKTSDFSSKLKDYLSDPSHKDDLKKLFLGEAGKQMVLNSVFDLFLANPVAKTLQTARGPNTYFGFIAEQHYNMKRLSKRVYNLFLDLVETYPLAELKTLISDFRILDSVRYHPRSSGHQNIFGLDYSNVMFYKSGATSRHFDGLGILDFVVSVISTHIKSTWMENLIEADSKGGFQLVSGIINDGISSMIVAIVNHYLRKGDLESLPPRTVQLVAPLIAKFSDYPGSIVSYDTYESRSNIEFVYRKFFSKENLMDLGYKLADHEIFMVELAELVNTYIDSSSTPRTRRNIESFIKLLFKDKIFRVKVKEIAQMTFGYEVFINQLIDGKGYEDLENMILKDSNLNKLLVEDINDNVRFGLLLDYKPHFKTEEKLSVSDFSGDRVTVVAPGFSSDIQTDHVLHEIIDEFGALVPIYVPGGQLGQLILMPTSLLYRLFDNSYPEAYEFGYKDKGGKVHTGYFLCDNEGYKLNSKLEFGKSGVLIRSRSDWASNFYDYDIVYVGDTFIYQSNFFSAYTLRIGKTIHSNLQDTFLNLEHINPTEQTLPNLDSSVKARRDTHVILRKNLIPEISKKAAELAIVLNQLGGIYTYARKIGKILVSEAFLNLNYEGYRYSIPLFKKILASLKPKSGDTIYDDGSIVDPAKANYWLKQITRGLPDATGKFIYNPKKIDMFYESWLSLIQNDLKRGKSEYFEEHRGKLESLVFTASEDVYKLIDNALEDAFGYPAFISLLAGIMTFSEDSSVSEGYAIDFWCHSDKMQRELLNKFVGRSMHDHLSADLGERFFSKVSRLYYFASIFLLGAKRGDRLIKPSSSFFLDKYYRKHIFLSNMDYTRAIDRFLYRSFSEYLGEVKKVQKLNEMQIKGRLELFNFLAGKLDKVLEKLTLPHEGCRDLFLNLLMKRIIRPTSHRNDIVMTLRNIFFTGSSGVITLNIYVGFNDYFKVSFEVTYEELKKNLTPDQLFTMNFYTALVRNRDSGYYLDFDLVWGNLAPKVKSAYNILTDVLNKAPTQENGMIKVEFYGRTATGIEPITTKTSFLSTLFSQSEFNINPRNEKDLQVKALSMVFWMMMEPNMIAVVKLPDGDIFLMMDIYGTYFDNEQFSEIFSHSDMMAFSNFHNHELSEKHTDIISYIMDKFKGFYWKFLGGDQRSNLFDLR